MAEANGGYHRKWQRWWMTSQSMLGPKYSGQVNTDKSPRGPRSTRSGSPPVARQHTEHRRRPPPPSRRLPPFLSQGGRGGGEGEARPTHPKAKRRSKSQNNGRAYHNRGLAEASRIGTWCRYRQLPAPEGAMRNKRPCRRQGISGPGYDQPPSGRVPSTCPGRRLERLGKEVGEKNKSK